MLYIGIGYLLLLFSAIIFIIGSIKSLREKDDFEGAVIMFLTFMFILPFLILGIGIVKGEF